jgi:RimJ/RimL family protein N-acetyltransferase
MLMPRSRVLLTNRCALRYPQLSDAGPILEALTHHLFPKELPVAKLNTNDKVMAALRERQDAWRNGSAFSWYVHDRDGGSLVGMIRIAKSPGRRWELAFWVHPQRWRKGYAREFTLEVLRLTFSELGGYVVTATAPAWNVPSWSMLEGVGFKLQRIEAAQVTGVHSDTFQHHYELSKQHWRAPL